MGTELHQASKSFALCQARHNMVRGGGLSHDVWSFIVRATVAWLKAYLEASCLRIRFVFGALEAIDTSSTKTDTISLEKKVVTVLMINIFEL